MLRMIAKAVSDIRYWPEMALEALDELADGVEFVLARLR